MKTAKAVGLEVRTRGVVRYTGENMTDIDIRGVTSNIGDMDIRGAGARPSFPMPTTTTVLP